MTPSPASPPGGGTPFESLRALVEASGVPHTLHAHQSTRTIDEARANLSLDVTRIVKTIAFGLRDGRLVLAALRGTLRVDYAKLAAALGVNRRDVAALAPAEVLARLGVEPGSVSPLPLPFYGGAMIHVDEDVLGITPTLYCGFGRPDRTLEIAPADLLVISGARPGAFSRAAV